MVTGRKRREPGPNGFTWRGVKFSLVPGYSNVWASDTTEAGEFRLANWRVERGAAGGWHARLKIGGDRFPGVGETASAALEAAAAEARNVATYIVAMLPAASSPAPRRSKRPRRGSICNGGP